MIDVEIDLDQKDASGAVDRGTRRLMEDAMDIGFAQAQELVPEDRGTLRASGFQPTWENNVLRYGFRANHAAPQEFGTQPFWAPIDPLKEWAERVTGDPGFGYYVQWKIAQEGIDANPYMRPSADKAKQFLQSRGLEDYLDDELR